MIPDPYSNQSLSRAATRGSPNQVLTHAARAAGGRARRARRALVRVNQRCFAAARAACVSTWLGEPDPGRARLEAYCLRFSSSEQYKTDIIRQLRATGFARAWPGKAKVLRFYLFAKMVNEYSPSYRAALFTLPEVYRTQARQHPYPSTQLW